MNFADRIVAQISYDLFKNVIELKKNDPIGLLTFSRADILARTPIPALTFTNAELEKLYQSRNVPILLMKSLHRY